MSNDVNYGQAGNSQTEIMYHIITLGRVSVLKRRIDWSVWSVSWVGFLLPNEVIDNVNCPINIYLIFPRALIHRALVMHMCQWTRLLLVRYELNMMTSSDGNVFRVTGPLWGEFTGHRWIPITKASEAELWCFFFIYAWTNGWINTQDAGDLRRHCTHYDVIIMKYASLLQQWCIWKCPLQNNCQCIPASKYQCVTKHIEEN